jgi:hypothetical protein
MSVAIAHNRREIAAGTKFGSWTVLSLVGRIGMQHTLSYSCSCVCGTKALVSGSNLKGGKSTQCSRCRDGNLRPYESLFNATRNSATSTTNPKQRTHLFTLSYDDFAAIIGEGRCHYCWVPLVWARYMTKGSSMAYQMDRKDNALGYIPGNVVACCQSCNYAKCSFFTYDEWSRMTHCLREAAL